MNSDTTTNMHPRLVALRDKIERARDAFRDEDFDSILWNLMQLGVITEEDANLMRTPPPPPELMRGFGVFAEVKGAMVSVRIKNRQTREPSDDLSGDPLEVGTQEEFEQWVLERGDPYRNYYMFPSISKYVDPDWE